MDWNHVFSWGSPVGLGVFFVGLGALLRGLGRMKHHHHWDKEGKK
ncbi:MAG TPA: hypothetical protein VGF75_06060 [Candidatus Saccharimonadales bacterium]|jgi:hypothetical protein